MRLTELNPAECVHVTGTVTVNAFRGSETLCASCIWIVYWLKAFFKRLPSVIRESKTNCNKNQKKKLKRNKNTVKSLAIARLQQANLLLCAMKP